MCSVCNAAFGFHKCSFWFDQARESMLSPAQLVEFIIFGVRLSFFEFVPVSISIATHTVTIPQEHIDFDVPGSVPATAAAGTDAWCFDRGIAPDGYAYSK